MSQSPELPDLDRLEARARAATPGPWDMEDGEVGHDVAPFVFAHKPGEDGAPGDGMRIKVEQHHMYPARKPVIGGPAWNRLADCALNNAAFIAASNPAAVLALIALARRAKPEGEAPQAGAVAGLKGHVMSITPGKGIVELHLDGDVPEWADPGYAVRLFPRGAAQHAALAAQSQGAQAGHPGLIAEIECLNHRIAVMKNELKMRHDKDTGDVWYWQGGGSDDPASMSLGMSVVINAADLRAAIAAKAEAPADDPYALEDDDEVRFPNDTQVAIVSAKRYYELRGFEERAQQAAAPGALNAEATRAIRRAVRYLEENDCTGPAEDLKALLDVPAAPSAPGTPEAPSLEDCPEDDQQWAKVDPAVAFHLIERHAEDWADAGRLMLQWHNAINRAAQLDGGQGEGVSHG